MPPTVVYADIYKKDTIVVTPRKIDGEVVATFHYGKGETVVAFKYMKDGKASENGGDSFGSKNSSVDGKGDGALTEAYHQFKENEEGQIIG